MGKQKMARSIPLLVFYIAISVCSWLSFLCFITTKRRRDMILTYLELLTTSGSGIYYAYLAIRNLMDQGETVSQGVSYGFFRYTVNFAFSAKFLFCLINCTTVIFVLNQCNLFSSTTIINNTNMFEMFDVFRKNQETTVTLSGVFMYILLPIATTVNLIKFTRVMKVTNKKSDITAMFILAFVWVVYMTIMTLILFDWEFEYCFKKAFTYTFLNLFIGLSGLPLYDYFFLYDTTSDGIL